MKILKLNHSKIANITDNSNPESVNILINNVVHIKFKKIKYLGLLSWYESKCDFRIEIYLKGQIIKTQYNSLEKWKSVLNIIDDQV